MKVLILAGAALLLALPALAEDADLSIEADNKVVEVKEKDAAEKPAVKKKTKSRKKTYTRKKRGASYKFKAQDSHQYKYDKYGKPLTGKKKKSSAGKKSGKKEDAGYKFRREGTKSSYKLDEEANPIGTTRPKKSASPKKPAPKKKTRKEEPPPYDDSLSVDKKVISLEGE